MPLIVVGLVFRRGARQLRAAGAYREVAAALGLEVDTRGVSLHGVIAGRPLWVGEVVVGHGPERRSEVHGVIGLRRPLALGLRVGPRTGRRIETLGFGDPDLDRRLVVSAAWAEGWRGVLDAGGRGGLVELGRISSDLRLTDEQVRVHLSRPPDRPSDLAALVEALEGAAEALEAGRAAIAPPPELEAWIEPWTEVAHRFDLGIVPTLPALRGRCRDHVVEIGPEWTEVGFRARICVLFEPDEPTGLRLEPQRAPDGYQNVGQDIQVGDPDFDGAFVIKGFDPEHVRERLHAEVRADLLELLHHGALTADDHRLCLAGVVPDVRALIAVLPQVLRAADALAPPPVSGLRWSVGGRAVR